MGNADPRPVKNLRSFLQATNKQDRLFYVFWVFMLLYAVFSYWGDSYDDVFLAFRYARNLEAGHGFVFNPGENVLATPAPFFVLLLVVLHKVLPFLTIPQTGSILSGFGLAWSALLLYQVGRTHNARLTGTLAALLIVTDPLLLLTMGGETPLFIAIVLAAILSYEKKRFPLAGFLLGLAFLNRTEALVPIALLFALYLLQNRQPPWAMAGAALATVAPWLAYATVKFGSPLTNSFGAKISQVTAGLPRYPVGLLNWVERVILDGYPWLLFAIPAMALGFLSLFGKSGKPWRLVIAWTILQSLLYALLPIPFYHWYAAQYGVLAAVLVALGTIDGSRLISVFFAHRLSGRAVANLKGLATAGLALFAILVGFTHTRAAVNFMRSWPHGPANRLYAAAGDWFKANTPQDSSIAYLEIGAIGYYSDRHIIDTLSLVTPELGDKVAAMDWLWAFQHYRPEYIVFNELFNPWLATIYSVDWFREGYHEVARISVPDYAFPLIVYEKLPGARIPDPPHMSVTQNIASRPVGKITADRPILQTFVGTAESFSAFELRFATYGRTNRSTVLVALSDSDGKRIKEWQIDPGVLYDNAWYRFSFSPVANSRGNTYNILIRSEIIEPDDAVSVWHAHESDVYPDGNLTIAEKQQVGDLSFRVFSKPSD